MSLPGDDTLQMERERQAEIQRKQEERQQVHLTQQQAMQDFFATKDASAYENKDMRTSDEIITAIKQLTDKQESAKKGQQVQENVSVEKFDLSSTSYLDIKDQTELLKNQMQMVTRDKKWYNFFKGDSTEMKLVKKSLNYLNNLMEQKFTKDPSKLFDSISEINDAYARVLTACEGYEYTHPAPKYSEGRRRLAQIKDIKEKIVQEQRYFSMIKEQAKLMKSDATQEDLVKTIFGKYDSMRAMIANQEEVRALFSIFQPQGNSKDTYYCIIKDKDGRLRCVYVKKDEKLLKEDPVGYMDRRIRQLEHSKNCKQRFWEKHNIKDEDSYETLAAQQEAEITQWTEDMERAYEEGNETKTLESAQKIVEARSGQEELRLRGKIDDVDYDFALRFLKTMKDTLASLEPEKQEAKKKRYLKFLGHDFDRVFSVWKSHNTKAARIKAENEAKKKEKEKYKNQGNLGVAMAESIKLEEELPELSEYEWIEGHAEEMGLNLKEDAEILQLFSEYAPKEGESKTEQHRISKLFQRSLGKEAELYGQQYERGGEADTTDSLASNNTMTTVMANEFGTKNIICTSQKEYMVFQEAGKQTMTKALCIVAEAAEGEELLTIIQQAEKVMKEKGLKEPIIYHSPESIAQLLQLDMNDKNCLQTDRHWRNFKCKVKKTEKDGKPVWIIQSLKAYDHDQSFGTKDLDTYFKEQQDQKDGEESEQAGFMSPVLMNVKKKDMIYDYLVQNQKIGVADHTFSQIKKPEPQGAVAEFVQKYKEEHDGNDYFDTKLKEIGAFAMLLNSWQTIFNSAPRDMMKDMEKDDAWKKLLKNKDTVSGIKDATPENVKDAMNELLDGFRHLLYHLQRYYDPKKKKLNLEMTIKDKLAEGYSKVALKKSQTELVRELQKCKKAYLGLDFTGIDKYVQQAGIDLVGRYMKELVVEGKKGDNTKLIPGALDYLIQSTLFLAKNILTNDRELMEAYQKEEQEIATAQIRQELQIEPDDPTEEQQEQINRKLKERGFGDISVEVPTLLHMDKAVFENIKATVDNWPQLEKKMIDEGWSTEKRMAHLRRMKQFIEQAYKAEKYVKDTAKAHGFKEDDIRAKYFLEPEDYKKLKNLTDLATDPAKSYFAVEDKNFLVGVPEYKELLTDAQVAEAVTKSNNLRKQERQSLDQLSEYHQMINNKIMSLDEVDDPKKTA